MLIPQSSQPRFKQIKREPNPIRQYMLCKEVNCDKTIQFEIENSKKSVRIQNFNFGHTGIGVAIFNAKYRGIKVEAILQSPTMETINFLMGNDIPTWIDQDRSNTKTIIIDDLIVIQRINDVLEIDQNPVVASIYMAEFWKHTKHSMKLEADNN